MRSGSLCLLAAGLLISTKSKGVHAEREPEMASIPAWLKIIVDFRFNFV